MGPLTVVQRSDGIWVGRFEAMASPCEILARCRTEQLAVEALTAARREAERIEKKFSRYREDSVVHQIHASRAAAIQLDDETSDLLDFAENCWGVSEGAFDITSGLLREAWRFSPESTLPSREEIDAILPFVGWNLLSWDRPYLTLPQEMEVDLGGIGKEYAVDRVVAELETRPGQYLVNFGGDIRTTAPSQASESWTVGIESPARAEPVVVELKHGALATSGDTHRFILHHGVRYGHVFDPRTGWPPPKAPRTATVHSSTCLEAGLFATLAILHGEGAEDFLQKQNLTHWVVR